MKTPKIIEFVGSTDNILRKSILASIPLEGCALLIGNEIELHQTSKEIKWQIQFIWPCSNIWDHEIFKNNELLPKSEKIKNKKNSKRNHFAIDPKEQISAQKWARSKNWVVLGSAHSHPDSDPIPSAIDLEWSFSPRLMIILDKLGEIRAWWIKDSKHFHQLEVAFNITSKGY